MQVINNLILLHHFNERLENNPSLKTPIIETKWTKHERRFTGNSVSDVQFFQLWITYNILQIDSLLPCICSVIDHR